MKKGYRALIEEAEAEVRTLPTAEAIVRHGDEDTVFVDLRDVRELEKAGAIPGAVHAPRGMLEFWVDPNSPYHRKVFDQPDKTFVLFCAAAWRSALAAKTLQDMGMANVAHVQGGFTAWAEGGGPVAPYERKSK